MSLEERRRRILRGTILPDRMYAGILPSGASTAEAMPNSSSALSVWR